MKWPLAPLCDMNIDSTKYSEPIIVCNFARPSYGGDYMSSWFFLDPSFLSFFSGSQTCETFGHHIYILLLFKMKSGDWIDSIF